MLIGVFCDSVLRLLSSFQYSKSELNFERRDIFNLLNDGIGNVVTANFWSEYNMGDMGAVDAGFIQTFDNNGLGVPVQHSLLRDAYYTDLPALPIALPSGLGLFEVVPPKDMSAAYIPLSQGSAGLFKGLESERLFGEAGYRQEGKRIWYVNGDFQNQKNPVVIINMICDTSNLTLDDELPIPPNYVGAVRDAIIQIMTRGLQIPADTSSDSAPNNRKA